MTCAASTGIEKYSRHVLETNMQKLLIAIVLMACAAQVQAQTPAGRYWHAAASNGGTTAATSRVYVFGGTGGIQSNYTAFNDLWYYQVDKSRWTLAPTGRKIPTGRFHIAWSCGGAKCVAAGGSNGFSRLNETWYYTESTSTWSKVTCRATSGCPSARMMSTMAYDPSHGYHVLFGGLGRRYLERHLYLQRHRLDGACRKDCASGAAFRVGRLCPLARLQRHHCLDGPSRDLRWPEAECPHAVRHVLVGRDELDVDHSHQQGPCVHSASMAWDTRSAASPRLIVANGFVDVNDTQNTDVWYFTFSSTTQGSWALASPSPCAPRREAMGAFDLPSKKLVFFGGGDAPATRSTTRSSACSHAQASAMN